MSNLLTVASFDDLSIAYIARSKLEASGIPCFLTNEYLVGINFLYSGAVYGVELKVPENFASDARMLLAGSLPSSGQAQEEAASDRGFGQAPREPEHCCPRCGGADVYRLSLRRPLVALSYLL
ncbi:MAG: DUF2007 domain-containing protein, partial [Desulfovibrio sp.]|nr:DUF2007 domain-containing protein [Desulfovibrio sp.]